MWNCEWEYRNQEYLKERYEEKMSGKRPYHPVRKIICKGCGREFYTNIETKKYCLYGLCGNRGYQKELSQRRREARQDRVCKGYAARYLRPKDRTEYTVQTLADRKLTDKALRIAKCAF